MRYIEITNKLVDLKSFYPELKKLYVEVNDDGRIFREVGINQNGKIVHKYPSETFEFGDYGIFDLNTIESNTKSDIDIKEFEQIWNSYVRS